MSLLKEYGLTDKQVELFEQYSDLLLKWNEMFNLTAIKDKDEIVEKHFIDSLFLDKYVDLDGKSFLDVGSGAGFPGIPLAIAHPTCKISLLESNGKKIKFLQEVKKELGLENVSIIQARAEEFDKRESFDFVSARAVKELRILLEICFHLVKVGGSFVAYKSKGVDEEINASKNAFKVLKINKISRYEYNLPKSKDNRVLLVILKENKTLKKYPRHYSEIVKAPL